MPQPLRKVVKKSATLKKKVVAVKQPSKKAVAQESTLPDVRWVPINSVKQWKENPMGHNKQDVAVLAKILEAHEQRSPVIVWRENNVIYKGNGTHQAMKMNGNTLIKVQFEDFPSETAAIAYGIADNKASEFSDWDADVLVDLLSTEEMKVMQPALGFTESELRGLTFDADADKIEDLQKTDTGIKATVKISCKPEDRDEIRVILKEWATGSGFQEVVVK